jgi:uncharacterized protein (UPF0333 family)
MRGQLSLEFLLLFAIFLAALAIFSMTALNTNNSAKSTVNGLLSQKVITDLANTANDICILGEGNRRQLHVSFVDNVVISTSGQNITITYNGKQFNKMIDCEISDTELTVKDTVLNIEKDSSRIQITPLP